jgi:hypothetical protein
MQGLRVLVVDEEPSKSHIEAQLRAPDLQYYATGVHTSTEALAFTRTSMTQFDVVLAEVRQRLNPPISTDQRPN